MSDKSYPFRRRRLFQRATKISIFDILYFKTPYIVHPLEALGIAAGITEDEEVLAAAVLHDTVEDTEATTEIIEKKFGKRVAELVAAESEDKREDQPEADTWQIRKEETLRDLKTANTDARIVCLGDKLSNIRAIERDYERISEEFWNRFNQKDKAKHAWYYKGIAEILGTDELINKTPAYHEYKQRVEAVFGA